ncbi:MAG TPA: LysM peptidoglycan-binding domain-containing protein, partial [Actinomycetes bacterium]|nr:LysM peptidoglycan-binding domain-containing protein [Actinomycetes bacterium]
MHAHHVARTARLSAVTGLGAAVLVSAFALPAKAEPVNAVQRGPTKVVAAQSDQKRKKVTVKQGDSLSKIARKAKLSSWRPLWDLNTKVKHPNLIYPGQKLLIPAKGEKLKHRPFPAPALTRVVSAERSAAPAFSSRPS